MIRWLAAVWPPGWVLVLALLIYTASQAICLFMEWNARLPLFSLIDYFPYGLFGVLYGLYRVWAFHPAARPGYYNWLCRTPWTSRKPFPLGPIHLVWQDLVILGLAVGLLWPRLQIDSVEVVQYFLAWYLAALAITHIVTGEKLSGYTLGFGLGLKQAKVSRHPGDSRSFF